MGVFSLVLPVLLAVNVGLSNPQDVHPSIQGSTGLLRVTSSIPNQKGDFGAQLLGRFFSAEPFIDAEKHSRNALRVSGNYSFGYGFEAFSGFAFTFNEHSNAASSRSSTSFFENSDLGLRWGKGFGDQFYLGAFALARFFSGTRIQRNTSGFARDSSGPIAMGKLGLTVSADFGQKLPEVPIKAHFNLAYRSPNSSTTPTSNAPVSSRSEHIEIFNLDAYRYHALEYGLGFEAPYKWVTPFIEYHSEYALNKSGDPVSYSDNRQHATLGARITPHPSFGILVAGDLGFGGDIDGKGVGIPQNTPWEVFFAFSFFTEGKTVFSDYGSVRGRVIDSESGLPLPDVTATLIGEVTVPKITDLAGFYNIENLANGDYQIKFEKQGYDSQVQSFSISRGKPVILDIALETLGPKKGGINAVIFDSVSNEPVAKAYVKFSGMDRPLSTDEQGRVVADGLKEGVQNMRVEANGYEPADFAVEIFPKETIDQTFSLKRITPKVGNCLGTVTNEEGTGLTAVFTMEGGNLQPFGTDPLSGKFNQSLEEGTYDFKVQAENYLPQVVTCEVRAGEDYKVDVVLEKPEKATVIEDKIILPEAIFFGFDSDVIKERSFKILDQIADILSQTESWDVLKIEGHTDSTGASAYNQSLSERRAASVRNYLIEKGVNPEKLEAVGFGEDDPVATNLTPEGQAENRRVEFNLLRPESIP